MLQFLAFAVLLHSAFGGGGSSKAGGKTNPACEAPTPIRPPDRTEGHNYYWGTKSMSDSRLQFYLVHLGKNRGRKMAETIKFPVGASQSSATITFISAESWWAGRASVELRGGVDCRHATLRFASTDEEDAVYQVAVFGK